MRRSVALLLLLAITPLARGQSDTRFDYREVMVPMRDGVKLYTTVHVPRKADGPVPIIFVRTPYGIDGRAERNFRDYVKELADDGYAFAYQDIRGRYKSEGTFVMTRPRRAADDPKAVDEATDTNDTIDWLLKEIPNNNGRVGMLGISYPGWLTAVALTEPHPALRAASPQASPVDMFLGDDFHHHGAFRLSYGFEYAALMETGKTSFNFKFDRFDTYDWYLKLGPLSNANKLHFKNTLPTWNDFVAHPNYDAYWKTRSLEPRLKTAAVPTLHVGGLYDQEDFRGPFRIYAKTEEYDRKNHNFLVLGPWDHGGWAAGKGNKLGRVSFGSDTGAQYRAKIQAPFFHFYLKDRGAPPPAEAQVFQTGGNTWEKYDRWPPKEAAAKKLYFHPGGRLAFDPPPAGGTAFDEYISDPANPVPYRPRPVRPTYPGREWPEWMVQDQRFTAGRPDVLVYQTEPLTEDLVVAGSMVVTVHGATTGTDCDWVARLIDVHPEGYAPDPAMSGYQLMIAGEPVRARFRKSLERPEAVTPGAVEAYPIDLIAGHHRFRKGHRVMVQISSSWFPVIDRNPQTFVPNIFEAKAEDFVRATQRVYHTPEHPSHVTLDVIAGDEVVRAVNAAGPVR